MSEIPVDQKNLPLTQDNNLIVLLLVTITFYLYGFYWLDKQSSKLKQNFGICPFNESFIKYGYISYGLMFMFPAILETMSPSLLEIDKVTKTIILYLVFSPGYIMFLIYLYCSFRYAATVSKILGYKKSDLLVLLGTFTFHVVFLNWWQNEQASKQGKLSVNSN